MEKNKFLFGFLLLCALNLLGVTDFGYKFTPDQRYPFN
jgi:hypothetical protein